MSSSAFTLETEGLSSGSICVRLAKSRSEIEAAQKLRYTVFYEECGAEPDETTKTSKMEVSDLDFVADHLIVLDTALPEGQQVVGNYRLLRKEAAERFGKFYSEDEYNIDCLLECGDNLLELGRTCVHKDYRTRPVLELLWQGIADYVMHYDIRYLFGCASFMGTTDADSLANELSYLYHHHLAPETLRARTLDDKFVEMNRMPKDEVDVKAAMSKIPPLIRSYLRIGVMVSDGAFIDHQFNSVDVFITFDMARLTDKYKKHYKVDKQDEPVLASVTLVS